MTAMGRRPGGNFREFPETGSWTERAACKGKPVEWFFGVPQYNTKDPRASYTEGPWKVEALACCTACPVVGPCGEYAKAVRPVGIWAGQVWTMHGGSKATPKPRKSVSGRKKS